MVHYPKRSVCSGIQSPAIPSLLIPNKPMNTSEASTDVDGSEPTQKIQTEGKYLKTVLQIRESTVGRSDQFGSNTSASFKHSQEEYRQNQNRLHSKSHHLNISKNNLKNPLASSRFYASNSFADPGVSGFVTQ